MTDKFHIAIDSEEPMDYDRMSLDAFLKLIGTTISPLDIQDFANKAVEKIEQILTIFELCPEKCKNFELLRQRIDELTTYTMKSAEINKEAVLWLAVELDNQVKIYGR